MSNKKVTESHVTDRAARDMIVSELDKTIMVEAGAGSGKTTSLVNRMVALIGERKTTIEKMAAVTFTRKASAELREKFQIELEARFQEARDEKKELYGSALSNLEQGFTGTIHSFCARLLRERPVEAGIDPAFVEMDEIQDRIHQEGIWEEFMIRLHYDNGTALETLDALDVNLKELRGIYHTLVLYPEVEVYAKEVPLPDIRPVRKEFEAFLSYAGRVLPKSIPEKGWDPLQDALRHALRMTTILNLNEAKDFFRILSLLDKSFEVRQNRWPSKDFAKQILAKSKVFRESIITPALTAWKQYRHFHIIKILQPAADSCRKNREKQSILNFQDLLMKASHMLRDYPEVRRYFKKRLTHILIDEFQDTDPIQAEVILYLTGTNVAEKRWQKLTPEKGSLFIVGDPKQSIYRFRRADIDTYNRVKEIITKSDGVMCELKSNFRSLHAIADWLNPVFGEIFPQEGSAYQARFGELKTVRENEGATLYGVRKITISKKSYHNHAEIVDEDSERIAIWIKHALDDKIKLARTKSKRDQKLTERACPSDFLILLRNRKMIPEYAKKLEKYGIPFEVAGGNAFKTAYGLREIIKLLRAVAEPDSAVDLVSVLRGLFFGISDDMLYRFKKGGGRFAFTTPIPDDMEEDVKSVFQNAFHRLKQYKDWTKVLPPSSAIEKIIEDVGLIPYLLANEMGGSQTGAILKVQEFLQRLNTQGTADFLSVVEHLDSLLNQGDMDEIDFAHGSRKAVRIMNLHKAKGLEAPVVFLANPSGKSTHPVMTHIVRKGDEAIGYFAVAHSGYRGNSSVIAIPPNWEELESEEECYRDAEEDRLLYVASTRAKNLLVISTYPGKKDINCWSLFEEHLDGVPELDMPAVSEAKSKEKLTVTKREFEKVQKMLAQNLGTIMQQTYTLENVTSLTKATGGLPVWKRTGRGLKWGSVVHRVLEAVGKGLRANKLEVLISNVLKKEGRPSEEMTTVKTLINEIQASAFWKEVHSADEKYFEVPFSLRIRPSDIGLPQSSAEWAILSGTIDLVYKNYDGWIIIDYKTDDVGERIEDFVNYYTPQVRAYSRFWEEMSGEKVRKAGLYFIHVKRFIPICK